MIPGVCRLFGFSEIAVWISAIGAQHTRVSRRHQTDLTYAEWELIAGIVPLARSARLRLRQILPEREL